MPLGIKEFSLIVAIAAAVFVVGIGALVVGQCLMMGRIGKRWWMGLIPGYNLYLLFSAARCQVLFALYIVNAAFFFGCWTLSNPQDQELIYWPLGIGVLMVMWMSLALAGRMRLGALWQLVAFFLPSYAWCLMGLMPRQVDKDYYPWSVRPFVSVDRWLYAHTLGRSRSRRQALEELPTEDKKDVGEPAPKGVGSKGERAGGVAGEEPKREVLEPEPLDATIQMPQASKTSTFEDLENLDDLEDLEDELEFGDAEPSSTGDASQEPKTAFGEIPDRDIRAAQPEQKAVEDHRAPSEEASEEKASRAPNEDEASETTGDVRAQVALMANTAEMAQVSQDLAPEPPDPALTELFEPLQPTEQFEPFLDPTLQMEAIEAAPGQESAAPQPLAQYSLDESGKAIQYPQEAVLQPGEAQNSARHLKSLNGSPE